MSDSESDELERIRERKRRELLDARRSDESERTGADDDSGPTESRDEPVYADGREEFDRLVERHDVVLADFYADWCGPCQMLSPILESVAAKTAATVVKVDTDRHPALAQQYGVQGLPTLVLFVNGRPDDRLVGVQDEATLTTLIESRVD